MPSPETKILDQREYFIIQVMTKIFVQILLKINSLKKNTKPGLVQWFNFVIPALRS
jgi:hypothetical protein